MAEFDVFHQGLIGVATHGFEGLADDEDGLIAGGDARPAGAQVHQAGDHAQHGVRPVDDHIKATPQGGGLQHRLAHGGEGAFGQERVGVQEQQHVAGGPSRAQVHLPRTAFR
ncbi:hypothetical protein FQZ97_1190800 [compost metagenome]